jgi:hypothetical protein
MSAVAPRNLNFGGERFMMKAMDIIIPALREENPDLVVLYYSLSPFFAKYFDLNSPDDLGRCSDDFELEANRRFFFSSLMGEIGVPTWGSGGYEWRTMPDIWFDSAAIGTIGSLLSFYGPDAKTGATPEHIAKFNGLAHVIRYTDTFSILPVDPEFYGPQRGPHIPSWARMENGEVVLVALRQYGFDGELTLKRTGGVNAEITEHYFRGGKSTQQIPISSGVLRVPLHEKAADGAIVEWSEVDIH